MPTEKEFKTIITNISSNSEETKKQVFQLQRWVLNHRLTMRNKLLVTPFKISNAVTFLPFALGLFQFINTKVTSPLNKESFFQQNLPLFANLKPTANYETSNYLLNLDFGFKMSDQKFLLGQRKFIANIRNPEISALSSQKINGLTCSFYRLDSVNSFVSDNFTLDELPSYLQGLKESFKENTDSNNLLIELSKKQQQKSSRNKISERVSKLSHKSLLAPIRHSETKIHLVKKTKSQNQNSNDYSNFQNSFYKNQLDFSQNSTAFTREIQNIFIQKKIASISNDFVNKNLSVIQNLDGPLLLEEIFEKTFSQNEPFIIDSILKTLETQKISPESKGFRLMSGYNYPDVKTVDLHWYYKQNQILKKFFKTSSVAFQNRIFFHPIVSNPNYFFNIKDLPSVVIETKKLVLQNNEKKVFYTGPSLILDSQRAFDWKMHGNKNLRSWFREYISPLNPFTNSQENFFGIYESPKNSLEEKEKSLLDFTKNSLLQESYFPTHQRWDLVRTPLESNLTPFISSFHIPFQNQKKAQRFIRGIEVQFSNNENILSDQQIVPVIQLQQPNFRTVPKSKGHFQGYSPLFDLGVTSKPDYNFSAQHLNQQLFLTKYSSGSYTKLASIFSKSSCLVGSGRDNWEPLSLNSWLIISQLSFAVFIFQILKSLADNYGRELLGYLLDLVASLGFLDDSLKQEIEILMGQREKGFRVVLKSQKNFSDIVGIQKFLPEIYEIVWFLRNSARDFALSKTLPRGILLTGPPGTGKTLLVQALAGEAQVPVVVLSGSSLIEPGESGSVKLEMVFQEARQVAPCIVFIDEIDTLAQKRSGVVHNPMGQDELVETLTSFEKPLSNLDFNTKQGSQLDQTIEKRYENGTEQNTQQLGLLTQLLIELDGIQGRDGVIVIGATNRPEVLDPALLRPGRFDKILQVDLPQQQKRIEILQFYGQILGYQKNIPWNYLGQRTAGFTAADLATLMNESAIKAILEKSFHTIETIEHGIDRLTTSENEKYTLMKQKSIDFDSEKPNSSKSNLEVFFSTDQKTGFLHKSFNKLSISSKISILRLAYYQAGKLLLSYLLEKHPKSVVACLWPRRPTIRSVQITNNLQNSVFEFARICELNDRLVGCYAGKAAEFLFLESFSSRGVSHMSTLGIEDLLFAQKLIYSLLEKSCFYSKKSQIQKNINLFENLNSREFQEIPEKIDFYGKFLETIQNPPIQKAVELETSSLKSSKNSDYDKVNAQLYYSVPWWQQETSNALEFVEKNFSNWSRLYLSNPEQNERNPEWFPPDEFYHSVSGLKNIKKGFENISKQKTKTQLNANKEVVNTSFPNQKVNINWNDVSNLTQDYSVHSLVLQSLNKALMLLNTNREILDRLVIELLYNEILRQPEIEAILEQYQKNVSSLNGDADTLLVEPFTKTNNIQILETAWGFSSRKPIPRWINFAQFSEETT